MESVSTFVRFGQREQVQDEWLILDDPGSFSPADAIAIAFGLLLVAAPALVIGEIAAISGGILLGGVVCLTALWKALSRPHRKGYICLTNLRMLYYEQGESLARKHRSIHSINLGDVMGIHSAYARSWLGAESLVVRVNTAHLDGLVVYMGDERGLLSRIPLIGALFRRRTLGKDAFVVCPHLFSLISQRRRVTPDSRSSF